MLRIGSRLAMYSMMIPTLHCADFSRRQDEWRALVSVHAGRPVQRHLRREEQARWMHSRGLSVAGRHNVVCALRQIYQSMGRARR